MAIAEVVVDIKNKAVDRVFDYKIPEGLLEIVKPGVRVMVPFGPRKLSGFVIGLKETSEFSGTIRPLIQVMDVTPVLNEELLALGMALATTTGATMIACFEAMIPSAMKTKYEKNVVKTKSDAFNHELDVLFEKSEVVSFSNVPSSLWRMVKEEVLAGGVEIVYEASAKGRAKKVRHVAVLDSLVRSEVFGRSKKQGEAWEFLVASGGDGSVLRSEVPFSDGVLKGLVEKGVIAFVDVEVYREPYEATQEGEAVCLSLNETQQAAVDAIEKAGSDVVLLYGVTGSGKTEVYLQAMEQVVKAGKQVLVLIPEITLTTQLTRRFKARFGREIAVLHSGLSMGEKYDEWRKVLRGEVSIVIGARSAVFAPLKNIGLIVVDEEHEATYKQEEMPRYHAVEVAKMRGKYHGCPVVLGSATPSLESFARGKKGVYQLVCLPYRGVETASTPEVTLIDMNKGALSGSGIISEILENAIAARLVACEQVILFLNRRGYSNFMQCRDCYEVVSCPNCDVTLTYHKKANALKCHYCNFTTGVLKACPKCDSDELRFFGTGTQKVESYLAERFPDARLLRMDVDATAKKGDHERIIQAFEKKEADILIGTQMVAKGLDFPGVTLVGVIDGDMMLHFPDYKAAERTFQVLTQVAGRAGRHGGGAQVLIETYSPTHYVMTEVKSQDYENFYAQEMNMRRLFKYSPYFFHAKVLLSSLEPDDLLVVSEQVNVHLRTRLATECLIIGPTMATVARVNNRFRMHFILKYKQSENLIPVMKEMLETIEQKNVSVAVDYYPVYLA